MTPLCIPMLKNFRKYTNIFKIVCALYKTSCLRPPISNNCYIKGNKIEEQ